MVVESSIFLIAQERKRQIDVEGWDSGHDDEMDMGQLAKAAACYAIPEEWRIYEGWNKNLAPKSWPWSEEWWKPSPGDRIRELVKAGALIAAEIDRLKRLEKDKEEGL